MFTLKYKIIFQLNLQFYFTILKSNMCQEFNWKYAVMIADKAENNVVIEDIAVIGRRSSLPGHFRY